MNPLKFSHATRAFSFVAHLADWTSSSIVPVATLPPSAKTYSGFFVVYVINNAPDAALTCDCTMLPSALPCSHTHACNALFAPSAALRILFMRRSSASRWARHLLL